ncbi:MAG: SDR family NAD(P)-dependent oxidoreductase [Bacteroidales bacterium]
MKQEIKELIEISRFYGSKKDYVVAGGGNTSFKDDNTIWIKASGTTLADLSEEGLVGLDRKKLNLISRKQYSDDPLEREEKVKNDLIESILAEYRGKRPSVETSLHDLIRYRFVVHLHPAIINGLLCSRNAKKLCNELFGEEALFVQYTDPGYTLFKKMQEDISEYREKRGYDPKIILIENHGSFISADTTQEIISLHEDVIGKISKLYQPLPSLEPLPFNSVLEKVMPAIRLILFEDGPRIIRHRHNALIEMMSTSQQQFQKISHPLTPDIIVYCKSRFIYIEQTSSPDRILESFENQLTKFRNEFGFAPKVIVIKEMGVLAVDDSYKAAEQVLDVYEDLVKISYYSSFCGGIKLLTPEQVDFIDRWEIENYRRKVSKGEGKDGKLQNKIAVVTGAAQGFGAGITEELVRQKMNVVVADINEEKGKSFTDEMNRKTTTNRVVFIKTDVSDPESVKNMVSATVKEFGGLDLMISNAAVLKAGSLEEMNPETFRKITEINYNGYFYCAKYASEVMKIQNREKPEYFTDIIQINSKSGLKGSNKNFTYAGSKFGTIGLTQSFALELAPFRIKVNSICPGNFFDGPLWSDPQNGLFVQYLKAGKVPGARTLDDVKRYYEEQVPLGRGCRIKDVLKAIFYIIEQEYETGQAIPVTGGQVMLR